MLRGDVEQENEQDKRGLMTWTDDVRYGVSRDDLHRSHSPVNVTSIYTLKLLVYRMIRLFLEKINFVSLSLSLSSHFSSFLFLFYALCLFVRLQFLVLGYGM